jgi:twinkle protein
MTTSNKEDSPEQGVVKMHTSCSSCGSSDAMTTYTDHTHCFSCGEHVWFDNNNNVNPTTTKTMTTLSDKDLDKYNNASFIPLEDRGITLKTCKKFGVKVTSKGSILMPYFDDLGSTLVGYKVRTIDKDYRVVGSLGKTLFGQQLYSKGKHLTICEGELDALAAYQINGSRYAHVSIPQGVQGAAKAIANNIEYIEVFDSVIINYDNDDVGKAGAQKSAEVISPDKVKILTLKKHKDACDYLSNNSLADYVSEWWEAKPFSVEGIISSEEAWDCFMESGTEEVIPFPESFGILNRMLNGGIALGEITVIGAYTGVGKSTFMAETMYNILVTTTRKVGCIFFEARPEDIVESLLTVHFNQKVANTAHQDRDYDLYHKEYNKITDNENLHIYKYLGSSSTDKLFNKMRYLIKGKGCEVIIIDPLQAGVTSNKNEVIDDFMDRSLKLAKETNASIIIVSHLRKPTHNDAHNVNEYDMKGSGSINQIAFNTILLSRDKMSDCEVSKNTTKVQLAKCRRTGHTGTTGYLFYNELTGRLERGEEPKVALANTETEF